MTESFLNTDGANQSLARKYNSSIILNLLRLEGAVSRASLAKKTKLTRSTISRIIDELIADKLVREVSLSQGRNGRPGMLLELDPQGGSAIGIEIGVNFISAMLTDFSGTVLWRDRITLPDETTSEVYLLKAEELAQHALGISDLSNLRKMGIGVGIWGLVDQNLGIIRFAPNLSWHNIPLSRTWEEKFKVPVYLENDANASALGEYYFGAGKNFENFIYLSMDIGVGGGIISHGKLFRGSSGYAGEIGHMVVDPHGERCSCGKFGCLETFVGRRVIIKRYQQRTGEKDISLEEIIQRGMLGDEHAKQIFEEAANMLGLGLGNLINIFNPQRIILGWSLGQAYDLMLIKLLESTKCYALPQMLEKLDIVPYNAGADDCLLGCIALVLDEIIRERVTI